MYRASLISRVREGVYSMGEGEKTSAGKIATVEGVSKSPQLYLYIRKLVEEGYLVRNEVLHTNGHIMFEYVRTSKQRPDSDYNTGSGV